MPEAASVSRDDIGEPSQAAEATKSPVGAAAQRGSAGCGYTDTGRRSPSMRSRPTRRDPSRAWVTYLGFECRQFRQRPMVRTANYD